MAVFGFVLPIWTTRQHLVCRVSAFIMHFCFLPLEGVKWFPTAGICLFSATSSSTQYTQMHHSFLQTNEVLSCKSVIVLWSAEGVIVQTVPIWGFLGSVDVSALWWQKWQSGFSVVSSARATKQTNIIVSVSSRNVNCGIFQTTLLVCLGKCTQWFMDSGLRVVMWCGHCANERG